jgi:hypothetical protein
MTDAQKRFVELEKQKDAIKKYHDDLNTAVADVQKEIGINGFFQDPDGTVYQIVVPNGKFVYFEHVSYVRTRRQGEKQGSLSLTAAAAAGFNVPK